MQQALYRYRYATNIISDKRRDKHNKATNVIYDKNNKAANVIRRKS